MRSILGSYGSLLLGGWLALQVSVVWAQPVSSKATLLAYYCEPCGSSCDEEAHAGPGRCPHCAMPLFQRARAVVDSIAQRTQQTRKRNVAIFIHNGVEVLDFAGPSEVFAATPGFNVYTVSLTQEPIISQGFIRVLLTYSLSDCPIPDILVLPGGQTAPFLENEPLISWIKRCAQTTEVILSVCTGAGLLGKAGLLDGLQATTFHNYIEPLQQANPRAKILHHTRFVDNGLIITTAGIDGALHMWWQN